MVRFIIVGSVEVEKLQEGATNKTHTKVVTNNVRLRTSTVTIHAMIEISIIY